MKPWTAEKLKNTGDTLEFIRSRAEKLQSQCRAAWDVTTEPATTADTERDLLNRAAALLSILEDEIDHLFTEIEAAEDVEQRERRTAADAVTA